MNLCGYNDGALMATAQFHPWHCPSHRSLHQECASHPSKLLGIRTGTVREVQSFFGLLALPGISLEGAPSMFPITGQKGRFRS